MASLWYEELSVGDEWETASRTIDHADVMLFAGLTGDFTMLHTSEEFAKQTPFGRRIAHGLLGQAISVGFFVRLGLFETTGMAFLNVNTTFVGPIFLGDTVHAKVSIKSKRETKKADRGIVAVRVQLINQRAEVVQDGEQTMMIARKPAS